MRNVLIINSDDQYNKLFTTRGWQVTTKLLEADLIQFTGGEDVSPDLYGEKKYKKTYNNKVRDLREQLIFKQASNLAIPMAGICRGGQFLNVMCGGKMWQDVNKHGGTHFSTDVESGDVFSVTSTHHQMMRPSDNAQLVLTTQVSTYRVSMNDGTPIWNCSQDFTDVEACYYPEHRCFCFQPHPEFHGYKELGDRYIAYVESYLFSGASA